MKHLGLVVVLTGLWFGPVLAAESGGEVSSSSRGWAVPWPPLEKLGATRSRPLFAPDRRPVTLPSRPAESQTDAIKPRPQFKLTGVIVENSATFAVLKDMSLDESTVVRSGDRIGDWLVTVGADRIVTLAGENEQIKLRMFEDDGDNSD